jgi:hypothetical protein
MNDFINEQDQLCTAAVADILSVKIIEPDRIEYLVNEYKEIYKINQFSLKENKVELGRLYNYLSDLKKYYDKLDSAKEALNDYNKIHDTSEISIIKWLLKFEDLGSFLGSIIYTTGFENLDEIPDGFVNIHPDYDIKIPVAPYIPILDFVSIFDSEYDKIIQKYQIDLDEGTYMSDGREFFEANNKKLIDYVWPILNPNFENLENTKINQIDINRLKRFVPIRIDYYSLTSDTSEVLQEAHDLFHQDEYEKAKLIYKELLNSRNEIQEAWVGLSICNFILGEYENAYIASANLYQWRYRDMINYIEKYKKDNTSDEQEFYINDKTCEDSINNFKERIDPDNWLKENELLFRSISIKPKGYPSIANSHYNGKLYRNISEFHKIYSRVEYEGNILDTKSHLDAIIYFIETMNSNRLYQYLSNKKYGDKFSSELQILLDGVFWKLKKGGDKRLFTYQGICDETKREGYTFVGDKTGNYINLIITTENDIVSDIIDCNNFTTITMIEQKVGENINFDPDDIPF